RGRRTHAPLARADRSLEPHAHRHGEPRADDDDRGRHGPRQRRDVALPLSRERAHRGRHAGTVHRYSLTHRPSRPGTASPNGTSVFAPVPTTRTVLPSTGAPSHRLLGAKRLSTDMRPGSLSPSCERSHDVVGGFTCWRYCGGTSSQTFVRCTTP